VRRVLVLLAAAAVVTVVLIRPERPRALSHRACPAALGAPWRCMTLERPLDPHHRTGGAVRLAVALWHRAGPPRPAVVAFAGGPGGAALPQARAYLAELRPLLAHRDLLVFDQRGTGVSGRLSCPEVDERAEWDPPRVASCARRLGPARGFYASSDTARDTEAVRVRLRISRLLPVGSSYGTKTATDYARLYPRSVEALVLDSIVVADTDPLYRRSAVAVARILRDLCEDGACRGSADPVADLERLRRRMRGGALRARVGGRRVRITEAAVLHAIVAGGDRTRSALPGALHAAAAGDLGPLWRLLPARIPNLRADPWLHPAFSPTAYLATTCEDASFPWRRRDPTRVRIAKARTALAREPDSAFAPFDHHVAEQYGVLRLCADWPEADRRRSLPPLPDVPALLLAGAADALTPLEGAREVAEELPHSRLVVVRRRGHVVINSRPAAAALRDFAQGR
jgi:pimeloyl-ACP methyl ester carboxylesterase